MFLFTFPNWGVYEMTLVLPFHSEHVFFHSRGSIKGDGITIIFYPKCSEKFKDWLSYPHDITTRPKNTCLVFVLDNELGKKIVCFALCIIFLKRRQLTHDHCHIVENC